MFKNPTYADVGMPVKPVILEEMALGEWHEIPVLRGNRPCGNGIHVDAVHMLYPPTLILPQLPAGTNQVIEVEYGGDMSFRPFYADCCGNFPLGNPAFNPDTLRERSGAYRRFDVERPQLARIPVTGHIMGNTPSFGESLSYDRLVADRIRARFPEEQSSFQAARESTLEEIQEWELEEFLDYMDRVAAEGRGNANSGGAVISGDALSTVLLAHMFGIGCRPLRGLQFYERGETLPRGWGSFMEIAKSGAVTGGEGYGKTTPAQSAEGAFPSFETMLERCGLSMQVKGATVMQDEWPEVYIPLGEGVERRGIWIAAGIERPPDLRQGYPTMKTEGCSLSAYCAMPNFLPPGDSFKMRISYE